MKNSVLLFAKAVAGLTFVLFFLSCLGVEWLLELFFMMAFGWLLLLGRKSEQVIIDGSSVAFGMLVLVAFSVGSHFFLAWLHANWGRSGSAVDATPIGPVNTRRVWRARWTVAGVVGVLMMFIAGISMVGLVHQLVWLFRTEEILN